MSDPKVCLTDRCSRPHRARGLCAPCYMRAQRREELPPLIGRWPKRSPEERFWEKVEKSEDCWLWRGAINRDGYGHFHLNGRGVYAHRLAYELLIGPIPVGLELDHAVACPKSCVNPGHLRPATRKQNQENLPSVNPSSASGVRGVYRRGDRWVAMVRHHGANYYAGIHSTVEEARLAVVAKRNELFTHNREDRVG
ncbi:HNH endonuclease [Mycobacterium phage Quink]|uniref:HNH endonuclease n=1 Tax=Mycobacterium phage Quink TaxID=1354514 RepID=UPI00039271E5|nr:HNH endonuclease [Mycobacterium phage Quink]AGU92454.1 HNH endonuclease [Mycobacterium phage Quink]AXC37424.1 HNH endonuclease [Mycobacterium phage DoctorDiddles]QAY09845.1 HNH endonuclease [Mycobacterium phage Flabslab]WNM73874.1 HNH endonuclease [Mycobacterium Phage Holt]